MFELQPLYDSHQSFYGKALVERHAAAGGTKLVLKSYGTIMAVVTPAGMDGDAYYRCDGCGALRRLLRGDVRRLPLPATHRG